MPKIKYKDKIAVKKLIAIAEKINKKELKTNERK